MNPPLPPEFLNNMRALLGDETPAFLRALDAPPALALRLNPKRAGAEAAAAPFIEGGVPWAARGRYLKPLGEVRPGATPAHAAGAFYLQEASAMASAEVLDAAPGERVLDLCAAPGGKSTQIAAAMADAGLLVSNDPEPARAKTLAGNLERMGAANAIVVSAPPEKLAALWPEYYDAVLVDAPCSGEGMFRRDPATRLEWRPGAPEGCARRQAEILDRAATMVRPGGRLVYSTCTFNAVENEGSVEGFLSRHPDFAPEAFSLPGIGPAPDGMLRLWPHRVRGDGHFVARLRRAGERRAAAPAHGTDRSAGALARSLGEAVCRLPDFVDPARLFVLGDRLCCRPVDAPRLEGLRVLRPGLCLLRAGRGYVEPDHALAMALSVGHAHRTAELSAEQTRAWLRGEALPFEGEKGWTLVLTDGLPLGWGKASQGTLKNHLPKGLRRP